jgi:hypothetical protein
LVPIGRRSKKLKPATILGVQDVDHTTPGLVQ